MNKFFTMFDIKCSAFIRSFSLGVLIAFISYSGVAAQNLCSQNLKKAQKEYDEGRLTEVSGLLESCLKDGFNHDQKLQAYRLLILTNLFTDEPDTAEINLLHLLKEDPEYKINPAVDPAEFITLYNTYNNSAVISIGLVGGINQSRAHVRNAFSTDNANNKATYLPHIGFQGGVLADIKLYKNLLLTAGALTERKAYEYKNLLFNYSNLDMKEQQLWLELPLALKYNFGKRKLIPYLYSGGSFNLLLSATGNFKRVSINGDNDASGPNVALKNLRNKINYYAMFGTGLRYKLGYGYLNLDIKYSLGLTNVTNSKNRYSDTNLLYYYGYVDSNFTLNNLFITVGYFKSFYKPKKVKKSDK
jgi:hypothetical protein